jgi:hypothetical protein
MKKKKKVPIKIKIDKLQLEFIPEYQFHPSRKWRFDWCLLDNKIAIEIEGGVWSNGRHTRGSGFINDMEKYNSATCLGWKLLRYTPDQFASYNFINDLKAILCQESNTTIPA